MAYAKLSTSLETDRDREREIVREEDRLRKCVIKMNGLSRVRVCDAGGAGASNEIYTAGLMRLTNTYLVPVCRPNLCD